MSRRGGSVQRGHHANGLPWGVVDHLDGSSIGSPIDPVPIRRLQMRRGKPGIGSSVKVEQSVLAGHPGVVSRSVYLHAVGREGSHAKVHLFRGRPGNRIGQIVGKGIGPGGSKDEERSL